MVYWRMRIAKCCFFFRHQIINNRIRFVHNLNSFQQFICLVLCEMSVWWLSKAWSTFCAHIEMSTFQIVWKQSLPTIQFKIFIHLLQFNEQNIYYLVKFINYLNLNHLMIAWFMKSNFKANVITRKKLISVKFFLEINILNLEITCKIWLMCSKRRIETTKLISAQPNSIT